jgi:DNA-binding transcriptional LysR family regulator
MMQCGRAKIHRSPGQATGIHEARMNWDDLRYVLALAKAGSLAKAAKELRVDHTTVGRRVEVLESNLGVRLFTRTTTGYTLTAEADSLLPDLRRVEEAVLGLERTVHKQSDALEGSVRVTSGETFGASYLAPRLTAFGQDHPGLTLELVVGGEALDLARREADIAVRFFRSRHASLVVKRAGEIGYGLYASPLYIAKHRSVQVKDLRSHRILTSTLGPNVVEAQWVQKLTGGAKPAFVSNLTTALQAAATSGAGIAVLPRYLGDQDRTLVHIPAPEEPREAIWVTVHKDVQKTPRIRMLLDHLNAGFARDQALLLGR